MPLRLLRKASEKKIYWSCYRAVEDAKLKFDRRKGDVNDKTDGRVGNKPVSCTAQSQTSYEILEPYLCDDGACHYDACMGDTV